MLQQLTGTFPPHLCTSLHFHFGDPDKKSVSIEQAIAQDCEVDTFLPQEHTRHTLPVKYIFLQTMGIAYAAKNWQTRQGSKSPVTLQMT
jgi:hypothetical protein